MQRAYVIRFSGHSPPVLEGENVRALAEALLGTIGADVLIIPKRPASKRHRGGSDSRPDYYIFTGAPH